MKGVTSEVIAEIRGKANLVEVVSEYVALKRAGKEYKGLCPFHSDKHPSFFVNPDKGIYKCFACGEGGDVFAFVQKTKKIEFLDAARELAGRYGVQLVETTYDREQSDKRSLLLMLYEQAAVYFQRLLQDPEQGMVARQYLQKRGLDEMTIERFRLGYAPNAWDGLLRYLSEANKVSPATLEEAGLVRRRNDGSSVFDLFRHRLMIPICDDQGRVIAFGGRTLGDDQIKYLNSPESPIYIKGEHLFGLHIAKEYIRERDQVIVMEGYFDVITAHQFGFSQAVATLGTALTERQAKLLVRHTDSKRVFLCFDADQAGARAVERGAEMLSPIAEAIGMDMRVIRVPGGKDPDECLRAKDAGAPAFMAALEAAPRMLDYRLEQAVAACDLGSHSGRIEAAKQIVPILAEIKNSVARGEYIRQWAQRLFVREEELLSDVGQFRRDKGLVSVRLEGRGAGQRHARVAPKQGHIEAERQLLSCYLISADSHAQTKRVLANEIFLEPAHQALKEAIVLISGQIGDFEELEGKLMDHLAQDAMGSRALVDLILKVEEMREQKVPVDIVLKEGRARILKEKVNLEKLRLRTLLNLAKTDEEQCQLQSKIVELKQVETILLPSVETEEQLDELKAKMDEILKVSSQFKQLETSA